MEKSSSVYLKGDTLRVMVRGLTDQEHTVGGGQVFFLEATATPQKIGVAVLEALANFKTGIPHPADSAAWRIRQKEWCKIMEVKSWNSFVKDTKSLYITTEDELATITVTPYKNKSPKEGFEEITEKSRTCTSEPEALGKAILEAFDDCE